MTILKLFIYLQCLFLLLLLLGHIYSHLLVLYLLVFSCLPVKISFNKFKQHPLNKLTYFVENKFVNELRIIFSIQNIFFLCSFACQLNVSCFKRKRVNSTLVVFCMLVL